MPITSKSHQLFNWKSILHPGVIHNPPGIANKSIFFDAPLRPAFAETPSCKRGLAEATLLIKKIPARTPGTNVSPVLIFT